MLNRLFLAFAWTLAFTSQVFGQTCNCSFLQATAAKVALRLGIPAGSTPSTSGQSVGNIFIDTDDFVLYAWNGSAWVAASAAGGAAGGWTYDDPNDRIFTADPVGLVTVRKDHDGTTRSEVVNATNGASAVADTYWHSGSEGFTAGYWPAASTLVAGISDAAVLTSDSTVAGGLVFASGSATAPIRFLTTGSFTERMRIDGASGAVGIGGTPTGGLLHLFGAIKIADGSQANGDVLTSDANGLATWAAPSGAPTGAASGDLSGTYPGPTVAKINGVAYSADPVVQYALLAGRAASQTLKGGTAASETLTLMSTAHATKGKLLFGISGYDEVNNRLGVGTVSPGATLDVRGAALFNDDGADADFRIEGDTDANLFTLDAGTERIGIRTAAPVTELDVTSPGGNALPATSGTTQSAGHVMRLHDNTNWILDIGGNGASGGWIQSADQGNLATNYPLLLNPNGGNVGIGDASPGAKLEVTGEIALTPVTPAALTATVTDYAGCDGAGICRMTTTGAAYSVNSMVAAGNGVRRMLCNVSGGIITIVHEAGTGTAAYKFYHSTAGNITLPVHRCDDWWYDSGSSRWRNAN